MKFKISVEALGLRFEFATNVVRVVSRKAQAPAQKTVTVVADVDFQPYENSEDS